MEIFLSALMIMSMRVADVTLGTIRTLMVVQGRKYQAGLLGFIEVTIWVFAIRHIMMNLDNMWNILGYSSGFALGNVLGIYVEQKFGIGFAQLYIISLHYADRIADELRRNKFGVTLLPAEGGRGGVAILVILTTRRRQREAIKIIDKIDPKAFISIQSATPYRGFVHSRK